MEMPIEMIGVIEVIEVMVIRLEMVIVRVNKVVVSTILSKEARPIGALARWKRAGPNFLFSLAVDIASKNSITS